MLQTLDLLCSMHEAEVILSGKYAGHMLTKKGVRSGTSSEPVSCFSRKHSLLHAIHLSEQFLTAVLHLEEK